MADFVFFYKWAKDKLNIDLNAYKENQLQRRILTVMKSSGAKDLREYASLIEKDNDVRQVFLDYITINVTEFFRNKEIFDEFEKVLKTDLSKKHRDLKVWSAACSIGAEPYSISIIMDRHNINGKIVATDIDDGVLKKAKNGLYKSGEVKNVEKKDLEKYFKEENGEFKIIEDLKKRVQFKKHDLILDRYEKGFHAVVCRNVTIYFKNEAKDEIYRKIYESLVPGGVFFTGATESIYNPKAFGFEKLSTFIYQKV